MTAAVLARIALVAFPSLQGPEVPPDAEALMDESRRAVGAQRLAGVESVVLHGRVQWEGLEGEGLITEVYGGLGRARLTVEFGAFGRFEMGADGQVVWEKNPFETVVREGWVASEYLRTFAISQHVDWRTLYSEVRRVGARDVDGRRCWELHLVPRALVPLAEGSKEVQPPDQWFVDATTLLPRRYVTKSLGLLDEPVLIRMDVEDWREVDGVQYPRRVSLEISGYTLVATYDSIRHGVDLAEDFFEVDDDVRKVLEGRGEDASGIQVVELAERDFASIRVQVPHAEIQRTLSVLLPEALQHVLSSGATMDGPPLVVYYNWGDTLDLEAGIPITAPVAEKGRVRSSKLPAGKAIVAWHVGPYDRLGDTHTRVLEYLEQHGLERRAAPWEEYWTDPGLEPDSSKWRTKVVWPVKEKP